MTRRAFVFVAAFSVSACTLSAGDWFANLRPTFEARYAFRADRDVGESWQKLNTDYQVRMTEAVVAVEAIELLDLGGGSGGLNFDPANPPPRYSNCHNGHCHRDDGALVSYEDIAAEVAGGGTATALTVVSLPVGDADLLAPVRRELTCEPGCGLPQANVRRVRATVTRVVLEGLVRDGRLPARLAGEIPWRWDATLAAGTGQEPIVFDGTADLPADNAHPPNVRLDLTLELGARSLDNIEWMALAQDTGAIDFSAAANASARALLRTNLAEGELSAAIQRSD